ncbi:unnamed protein product [Lactuca virosa]|uniref:Core domain-containing protein n=1 Tax=Lactuca virosa TaxID=75947 RepID=A0AAU9N142_9ASTR|nr:unnamed protein product [Lactuca virosa]
MAFSSTVHFPSLCRLSKASTSSSPLIPSASISIRSSPSHINLNIVRKNFSIRAISTQAPTSGGIAPAIDLTDNALKHLNKMRENARPDDTVMEYNGFVIVCDPKSLLFIFGMQLDFSDALIGGGFSFKNPNATQTCGCGKSFAAEM